jgi:hypothetical protein
MALLLIWLIARPFISVLHLAHKRLELRQLGENALMQYCSAGIFGILRLRPHSFVVRACSG